MSQNTLKLLILIGIFIFGSIVISHSGLFSQARIDMTENKLFTLNDGTKNILQDIEETIQLKLYYSDEATAQIPLLRTYKERVVDLISEMVKSSSGKLNLTVLDPKMFTPEEDEAAQYGLQAVPAGDAGENIFFGLVGENTLDNQEVIPFLQPDRESFLEFDIAQLIYSLSYPERKTIGIISSLPLEAGVDSVTSERTEEQVILTQLKKSYDVQMLSENIETVDDSLDLLMIVHPKDLAVKTLFAIDQYVMKGGRLIVFVDPYAQNEIITPDPNNPMAAYQADKNSTLGLLFQTWGVNYDAKQVVLDEAHALGVQTQQSGRPTRHLAYLGLNEDSFNQEDIITRELATLNTVTIGHFDSDKVQAILYSSEKASLTSSDALKFLMDPNALFNNYNAENRKLTLAGRLHGEISTSFPDGVEGIESDQVVKSIDQPNVVLFADVDLLFDPLWVRSQNFFGRKVFSAFADNGNLIINLMDNMAGSPDLINIRGRKNSARPFTKVIELQNQSDKRFRETENLLKQKLRETEQKLNELQRQKGDQNRLILSQEQEQELQKFQAEKLDVRKKLREVRRSLDKDIEDLGSWLKFINIGLIPLIISLFGVLLLWFIPKRRGGKYAK
jgi:ABC-type uncharacterized transport system involved in gliding motility auxiliary subunit